MLCELRLALVLSRCFLMFPAKDQLVGMGSFGDMLVLSATLPKLVAAV